VKDALSRGVSIPAVWCAPSDRHQLWEQVLESVSNTTVTHWRRLENTRWCSDNGF